MEITNSTDTWQYPTVRNVVAVDLQTNTVSWHDHVLEERAHLLGAPLELIQNVMDILPTFEDRIRMCRTCKLAWSCLEWRLAPPLTLGEEMSNLGLGDVGTRAVAWAIVELPNPLCGDLYLGNNGIGDSGAIAISKVLMAGCPLRRLSLRDNVIGDLGAQALASALAVNSPLQELDIWNNPMSKASKLGLLVSARCKVFVEPSLLLVQPVSWLKLADGRMRAVLFEWIAQLHTSTHGQLALDGNADPQDLLFRTFSYLDTYFSSSAVQTTELQLMGVVCMLVASFPNVTLTWSQRHEEVAMWLAMVSDSGYTGEDVKEAAERVTTLLGVKMLKPTPYTFLRRYLRKTGWTQKSFSLANYLLELAVMDRAFAKYAPQAIAAAATILSKQYASQGVSCQSMPAWRTTLLKCTQLDVASQLAPCTAALSKLHLTEHGRCYRFVNKKYTWSRLHAVAKIKPNPPAGTNDFAAYLGSN